MECHATTLPSESLHPEPRFYSVGCEACHGPGQAHIDAAKSQHPSNQHMEKLGELGGTRINELCGTCHRTAKHVPKGESSTQRFQPYGLGLSQCFIKSGDRLTCITCHDPHKDVSTDTKSYEAICLGCHAPPSAAQFGPSNNSRTSCSVNPTSGCIQCHMPVRPTSKFLPISMADHHIRIRRPGEMDPERDSADIERQVMGGPISQ
jgi:hypothetical protein